MAKKRVNQGFDSGPAEKPGTPTPDVYVGLLFVAAASLLIGCIFLMLELNKYEWQLPG